QREAYRWFGIELANLRVAFWWAAERGDVDVAATIATYAAILGHMVENHEPLIWAAELLEPARAVDHPRLATLYVLASERGLAGRIDASIGYKQAAQEIIVSGRGEVMFGYESLLGRLGLVTGQPEEWADWCRPRVARGCDTRAQLRASMVLNLTAAGENGEAMAAATGLVEAAETSQNPFAISFALLAYGFAYRDVKPLRAIDALRRGLAIAHDNGVRAME